MKHVTFVFALVLLFALAVPSFASLPPQETSCTAGFVGGDVDGDGKVTSADAAELMKHLTGWSIPGDASHADTLRDGVVNAKDAAKLMQYLAGWNVGRLCHDDEYVVVEESTVDKRGRACYTCRVCGDVAAEEKLPYKVFSVCGTDITEYSVITAATGISGDYTVMMNAAADELLGGQFASVNVTSKIAAKKEFDHEILIGDISLFTRDGLPDLSDGQPCYGVTEDGTVFFNVRNVGMFDEMWTEFLRERLGADFHIVSNEEAHLLLVSFDENGADAAPFVRRYTPVDLEAEGYKLVFEDDFESGVFDTEIWQHCSQGLYRAGAYSDSQVSVTDGVLHLKAEYLEDGKCGKGWYSASTALRKRYARGYYEARIKCSDNDGGFWSAFWIQGASPYTPENSQGGVGWGGCEIDILELFGNNGLTYNLYTAGGIGSDSGTYEGYHSSYYTMGDMINEYHTYALEWDDDYYTFYVDGIIVGQTAFSDGTSGAEEQIRLSLEISDVVPDSTDYTTEMLVDYLRIYQK